MNLNWLRPCQAKKKAKINFEKDSIKLINNAVFQKILENVRKHRDIKLVTAERRRNYLLVSETNYHTTNFFTENLLAIEMRKTQIIMNKPIYLGLSILDLSKHITYEFGYDYIKPKYGDYIDIAYDTETRFGTSSY